MKRLLFLIVGIAAIAGLVLVGCAPEPVAPPVDEEEPEAPPVDEEPKEPEKEVIEWTIQTSFDAANPAHIYGAEICDQITKMTDGRLVFKPYTGGSIVPATKEIDPIDQGIIDGTYTCTMYNLDKWAEAGLFSSSPIALTPESARAWFFEHGTDFINRMVEGYDVMALHGVAPQPAEIWAHSNVRLESVDDLKGLKMRCAGHGGDILSRLGVAVTFMPGGELYEAMERGVIDAFEYSSPAVDWPMGFHEVADYQYYSASRSPTDPLVFYVNKSKFEALPADLQATVRNAVIAGTDRHHQWLEYQSMLRVQDFIDYGTNVEKLPADIDRALLEETEKYYAEKAAEERPLYGEILDSLAEFKRMWGEYSELTAFEPLS